MTAVLLPSIPTLAWPVQRKALWSTNVQESVSGKETRIGFWSYPRWEYSINFEVLRSLGAFTEAQQVLGFYNARQGSYDDWLYLDPFDNVATAAPFGTGDGTTTTFQLFRPYGGFSEPVRSVATITSIKDNGVEVIGTPAVDMVNGIVTFGAAPIAGHPLLWTGTFNWKCRFVDDHIDTTMFLSGHTELKGLKFRTLK